MPPAGQKNQHLTEPIGVGTPRRFTDAGLLSKGSLLAGDIPTALLGGAEEAEDTEEEALLEDDALAIGVGEA